GEAQIILKPGVSEKSLDAIAARLLDKGHVEAMQQNMGTPTVERVGESLSGLPQPFVVRIVGGDLATLRSVSDQVVERLKTVPALSDVYNNDAFPVTILRIEPLADRLAIYGLTPQALGEQ